MAVAIVYTIDEVVEMLKSTGISRTSIYRAIESKKLKAVKFGKRYLISEKSLNDFLNG